jgi:hypothetical protein
VPLGYRVADKKVVAIPDEAVAVRTIFTRYLELGSIGALIEDLDRRDVRTKATRLVDGRVRGGIRFGTGALAHLLKNRFYIGEVAYRGAIHAGGHQAIIERELFEAVQARLAENAVDRRAKLRSSPAILIGRIFDDRGNRMSPSHTNKGGVRYRYYVSHAILQQRQSEAGSVGRVPAAEIETLVLEGIRSHLVSADESSCGISDRDLIVQRVQAVTIRPRGVEVRLLPAGGLQSNGACPPGSEYRLESSRRSLRAPPRQTSPSPVSLGPCRTPGLSRNAASVYSSRGFGRVEWLRRPFCAPLLCPVSARVEPVSGIAKRKPESSALRPAPHTGPNCPYRLRTGSQRLARVSLTHGNVGTSATRGYRGAETQVAGWGGRIRTREWTNQSPNLTNWLRPIGTTSPISRA